MARLLCASRLPLAFQNNAGHHARLNAIICKLYESSSCLLAGVFWWPLWSCLFIPFLFRDSESLPCPRMAIEFIGDFYLLKPSSMRIWEISQVLTLWLSEIWAFESFTNAWFLFTFFLAALCDFCFAFCNFVVVLSFNDHAFSGGPINDIPTLLSKRRSCLPCHTVSYM